jgi:hypothetical protein
MVEMCIHLMVYIRFISNIERVHVHTKENSLVPTESWENKQEEAKLHNHACLLVDLEGKKWSGVLKKTTYNLFESSIKSDMKQGCGR